MTAGMHFIPGGSFLMGSDIHYPEEAPARRVAVDGFWIDEVPVTNREFATFVEKTGYVTVAERAPDPAAYPGIRPEMIRAGSLLFIQPERPVPLTDSYAWWTFSFGASWRHPQGPQSTTAGRDDHPVVHVAYADAEAYAHWAEKSLPTEAEWEYAARGGLEGKPYAWGDEWEPGGRMQANYWQGTFPWERLRSEGSAGTSAARTYAPNGYGLYDMIGNVWEWTSDWYAQPPTKVPGAACCIPRNPRGGDESKSYDPCMPEIRVGRKVLKGGSHLCAPNYCRRYRPAARYAQPIDTSASHVGFRCVRRAD
jgi:formylglycine-generating enzyme